MVGNRPSPEQDGIAPSFEEENSFFHFTASVAMSPRMNGLAQPPITCSSAVEGTS